MKRILPILLIISVLLCCLSSCNQGKTVKLTSSNAKEYLNVQLVFGNVEQTTYTSVPYQTESTYLSCICYVVVTPKSDYNFQNANLTVTIDGGLLANSQDWTPKSYLLVSTVDTGKCTIYLDKNGYGVASIYFEKKGDTIGLSSTVSSHPMIESSWSPNIESAQGSIVKK